MNTTVSTIRFLFEYNRWGNTCIMGACENLTIEQWGRNLGHSWGSVHGVCTHLFAAEIIWLSRWKGESPASLLQPVEFPTFTELQQAWLGVDLEIMAFIDTLNDKRLNEPLTYTNTQGIQRTFPLSYLMLHVADHATHHRGELAAMLATLDVPHPETNILGFLIEKQRAKTNGKQ